MESYKFTLKDIKPQKLVTLRGTFRVYCEAWSLWDELTEYMVKKGIKASDPPMTIFHNPGDQNKGVKLDVETAVVIDSLFPGDDRFSVYELPELKMMASTVHYGEAILEACSIGTVKNDDPIDNAYAVLKKWIKDNGYRITGPGREIYLRSTSEDTSDPTVPVECIVSDPGDNVTEIQFPVKKI